MVNNNVCDLDKLIDGALSFLDAGETGTVSKEARALLGSSEAKPSTTTTKGGKTTKGKGKPKKAPAVDPKVAQLRADYEALNAIQHERDLQYRELQAENRRLNKALKDKKAKQTAEAKLAYEKRKAERTPEQQAKIDAQTQKMLEGAKRAREAKKALAGTVEPKETASNSKPTKPLSLKELVERARAKKEAPKNVPIPKEKITYGVNKEALKAKEQRAKIDAEIKRKQDLKDATEAKYKGDALKAKLKELQNNPVALENAKQAMDGGIAPQTSDELLANLLVKSQAERKKSETWEIAKGIADYNREIKNAPTREKRQAQTDLINKTNETYKGEALQAKLKELEANPKALLKAKKQIENGVDPLTPDDLLAHKLVRQAMATGKSKPLVSDLSKGFADYNREKASAPAREAQQARKDLLATTDAQYKGDNLQAKLKEIKANEEAMANAKKQIEANQDPTTPEELLAHNLVKQAENKSKIKPKITDLSKGFSKFANNERLAPKREAQALFNTKQQEIRNDINKAFENPDGTVDEKALQEHIQTLRDDDLLLAEARDEVDNKIAPYSIDSYLAHEIVKKLDAEPKEKKTADPTVEAVRKALNKTEDPNVLRQKEQRKQDIQGFEEELLAKYDTVDKLKKAVQAVKDNPDLLEETRKLIANGGFPTTLEQYIAMHQLKREKKPAGMPNKPSDLSKALTSVNRKVEPKEPPAPFSWLSDALSNKDNLNKATNALEGKKTPPSLKQMLGIKSKFKTPIEIQQAKEKAHRKKLDNYLIEKVPNATPRMRKSAVDRLMELYADGRTLTPEQFKTVMKQEMVPSGVTASFQNKLKELQAKLDAVDASDKRADIKYDETFLLQAKINAQLSSLVKPTYVDKINANIYLEPLLTVGSAVRDVLGSTNAVLSEAYLNTMTRLWLGKTTLKKEFASLKDIGKSAKVELGRIADNWKRAGEYARQGLVVVSHDKARESKLKPLFAYENKGFGSVKDGIESIGHWFEVAGNFRLNATDMYFIDTTVKHHIAQTIADGVKKDPNFKISKAQVEEARQYANWAMFKEDNWLTNNVANTKQFLNNLGALPFEVQGKQANIPLGDLLMRYTRTPINIGLRVFDITGLGDLRFIYANATKKADNVPIYDKKALKPFIKSGEVYTPSQVQQKATKGMVKLLTTGASSLAIGYWLGNTDVFSTGYTKENSDTEEAKGTRNDVYFNPQALIRFGSFKEEKGDVLIPLTPLLGQHVVGLRAAIRLAKGKNLTEDEKDGLGQAIDALATTLDVSGSYLGESTGLIKIAKTLGGYGTIPEKVASAGGTIIESLPKPFGVGSLGRDIATIADDSERVTKDNSFLATSANRFIGGTPFKLALPKKIDVTGATPKSNGIGKALGFPFKIAKADPVIKELRQVSRESGVDVQLTQVDRRFEIGKTLAEDYGTTPQFLKMNAQDFSKWQEIHNNIVYQSVKTVVDSEDYKSLTNPLDKADKIKTAKENPSVEINGKDYTPKELFLEYKLKGRVVNINK